MFSNGKMTAEKCGELKLKMEFLATCGQPTSAGLFTRAAEEKHGQHEPGAPILLIEIYVPQAADFLALDH